MPPPEERADLSIRHAIGPGEYPRLVQVWRSAVDATHEFLAEEHRNEIESRLASDYLPQVDLHVAERRGVPVGFAGVSGESLEMLFVDAHQRGQGVGAALLSFVVAECGVTTVDVNEQNVQAVEFYRRRGFTVVGRSELDDQGRPYPLLHLALRARTDIPSFRPSSEWYEDWPFGVDTSVRVEARVTGPAADRAVEAFLEPLSHDPGADGEGGARVHYRGGFTVESAPSADGGGWRIVLASAGEDGFDSVESAAGDLVDALRATPGEVRLAWHELPATRVMDAGPGPR